MRHLLKGMCLIFATNNSPRSEIAYLNAIISLVKPSKHKAKRDISESILGKVVRPNTAEITRQNENFRIKRKELSFYRILILGLTYLSSMCILMVGL